MILSILMLLGGIALTLISTSWLVWGSSSIAKRFKASDLVIGLTIVGLGTSMPELATSVTATLMGKTELAVGNIISSNILNIFLILGITATIYPLPFNIGPSNLDLGLVVLSSLMLFMTAVVFSPGRISKREGIMFTTLNVAYMISLIFIN